MPSTAPGRSLRPITRRRFLQGAAAVAVGASGCGPAAPPAGDGWQAGPLLHLLPVADHERIRIKASFREPLPAAPWLAVGEQRAPGRRTDTHGRFWRFDAGGLPPATEHRLRLHAADGRPLCDPWPLRTFPAPDAEPERLRLLAFTCAGGPETAHLGWFDAFVPIAARQRLLERALSFRPDACVANGDHVYWDLRGRTGWLQGSSWPLRWAAGTFDREAPVLGGPNEPVLCRAAGPQIAGLYGVRFRSLPTWFLQDDHDYFENDEASDALRTFPADAFMLDLARSTQRLYYPELPTDPTLPAPWRAPDGTGESFGSLRYGRLFEALLYDCRRDVRNATDPAFDHAGSGFLPAAVERWLRERTRRSPCRHLAHVPSTPVLWTAGKWGEWYPDVQDASGALGVDVPKPFWPAGWNAQHDRLLAALAERRDRTPLVVSGDLHALAMGRILRSNARSFAEHPVVSVLCGPVGTGARGFPSRFRGQTARPSRTLAAEEWLAPDEANGFSLIDVTPGAIRFAFFRWLPEMGTDAIDTLAPFWEHEIPRPERA